MKSKFTLRRIIMFIIFRSILVVSIYEGNVDCKFNSSKELMFYVISVYICFRFQININLLYFTLLYFTLLYFTLLYFTLLYLIIQTIDVIYKQIALLTILVIVTISRHSKYWRKKDIPF